MYGGTSVYTLEVPSLDDGPGSAVLEFAIDGHLADQTAVWQSGASQRLDLTGAVGSGESVPGTTVFLPMCTA